MPVVIKFQPILPREKFPTAVWVRFEKNLKHYMQNDLKRMLKGDMDDTVKGWDGKTEFDADYSEPFKTQMQLLISPSGQYKIKWIRISEGVEGHDIVARRAPLLRFKRRYKPHTQPGGKWGGPGTRSGDEVKTPVVWNWPGIEARRFAYWIANKRKAQIQRDVQGIVKRSFK